MKNFIAHWKTSLASVLVLASVGLYYAGTIDATQFSMGLAALTAAGFAASADGKTKLNDKN